MKFLCSPHVTMLLTMGSQYRAKLHVHHSHLGHLKSQQHKPSSCLPLQTARAFSFRTLQIGPPVTVTQVKPSDMESTLGCNKAKPIECTMLYVTNTLLQINQQLRKPLLLKYCGLGGGGGGPFWGFYVITTRHTYVRNIAASARTPPCEVLKSRECLERKKKAMTQDQ